MRTVMVEYQVEADRVEENERYVRAVFAQLEREQPDGIQYASFKKPDGVSFVHVAHITGDANPLTALAAFREFSAGIKERTRIAPTTTELTVVGRYRSF